jgi:hypothetical protein
VNARPDRDAEEHPYPHSTDDLPDGLQPITHALVPAEYGGAWRHGLGSELEDPIFDGVFHAESADDPAGHERHTQACPHIESCYFPPK